MAASIMSLALPAAGTTRRSVPVSFTSSSNVVALRSSLRRSVPQQQQQRTSTTLPRQQQRTGLVCRAEGGSDQKPDPEQQKQQEGGAPPAAPKRPPPPADPSVAKGQTTAIITGAISIIFGIIYLGLVSFLDIRGGELLPPPPEAFIP